MLFKYEFYSYWLFLWFILYYLKILDVSPLIFLLLASILVILNLIYLYKYDTKLFNHRFKNYIIYKLIPIILIFKFPIFTEEDIIFGFFYLYTYLVILLFNNKNPIQIYLNLKE